ncbi:MAG: hypothetical protein NCW75_05860 [Phycisphaera sp.]|nr:MAG: hypothetical protein NCW75_05860 [Phycisphaera sp.]
MARTFAIAAIVSAAGLATAQTVDINILVDEPVLAPGDSTTVMLEVAFTTADYAVAGVATDLLADTLPGSDISGAWSDWQLVAPMSGPGTTAGLPDGLGSFTGILAGQLNFPPAGIYSDPSNPIAFWQATFTAPLDSGGFRVDLTTDTSRLDMYPSRDSSLSESRLDLVVEGEASLFLVPAPAGALVLGLGLAPFGRRRTRN